jgi:hypothetical protein
VSEVVIFAIGVLVFLVTVYGAVVAGGLALTERQLDEDPELADAVSDEERESFLMHDVEY